MNIKEPIEIDFLDFFKTGKFDYIKLGQTKEWILNNFPDPDGRYDEESRKNGFDIWTYGDIEFHFEKENLFLIYSDHLYYEELTGGEHLKLKKWILNDIEKLNLLYVLEQLNNQQIDYKIKTDNLGVCLRLKSGIEMTFENMDEIDDLSTNDFKISSFGLVAENPYKWK